jgi:hypothetical protein
MKVRKLNLLEMKVYKLKFEGYWARDFLPEYAGIYLVYTGTFDRVRQEYIPNRLIYIGEASNIRERHTHHEHQAQFDEQLNDGEILLYATCQSSNHRNRVRIQDALIYKIRPLLNQQAVAMFNHPDTFLLLSGEHYGIGNYILAR